MEQLQKKYIRKERLYAKLGGAVLLFGALGYPIQVFFVLYLEGNSTIINGSFRALISLISVYLISSIVLSNKTMISKKSLPLLFFWLLYSIRLIIDVSFRGVKFDYETYTPFFIFSMAFGACLIPMIAVMLTSKYFSLDKLLSNMLIVSFVGNVLVLFLIFSKSESFVVLKLLSGRNYLSTQGGDESLLNPISIAFYGAILVSVSFYLLIFSKFFRTNWYRKIFLLGCLSIGLLNVALGASRGPFISLILILILIFFVRWIYNKNLFTSFVKHALIGSFFIILILLNSDTFNAVNFSLFDRIGDFIEQLTGHENVKDERFELYRIAYAQFENHPFFGDQIAVRGIGIYPHNLIIEVLMSTGFIGFILLGMIFVNLYKCFILIIRERDSFALPFFFVCFSSILLSLTSFSVFTNPGLWIILGFCLSINNTKYAVSK